MKALCDAIRADGIGRGTDIVKVNMFLNHRVDTKLITQMGQAFAEEFRADRPDLVLTMEASGIAIAFAAAQALGNLPMVYAKKGSSAVMNNSDMYTANCYSFTKKQEYVMNVEKAFLPAGSRVLIIDDFLADGQAVKGMRSLCEQAGAVVAGVGIAIEKGFQPGGRKLREEGIHLKSLAIVKAIENDRIILEDE